MSVDDEDDVTRVVARSTKPSPADDEDDAADDHTVVVARSESAPEPTGEGTDEEDDDTRVVPQRGAKRRSGPALSAPAPGRRRRGIAPPPVPVDFAPKAVEAIGPGAVESYEPRDITAPPANPVKPLEGPEATRASAPSMPSVDRRAHRNARAAVVWFAISCVGAVAGAGAIIWAMLVR